MTTTSSTSSACPCSGQACPGAVTNPPGLDQISYRATTFSLIRNALLTSRPGETSLAGWAPAPGDLGLQILEWWAYLGDILTFYNERIANEDYLRTATMPQNLAGLVGVIGYQPRPGIAATGQVAALRTGTHPNEPMIIPQGMAIASTATPGVASQNFEVSSTQNFTGPAQVQVTPYPDPELQMPSGGPTSVLLAGKVTGLKVGDPVLLVEARWEGGADNWCWTTVASLTPLVDPNSGQTNTTVTFASSAAWGPGGVGPPSDTNSVNYELLRPTQVTSMWSRTVPSGKQVIVTSCCFPLVHLNDTVRGISAGDIVLFDGLGSPPSSLALVGSTTDTTWYLASPAPASTAQLTVPSGSGTSTTTFDESSPPPNILYPHTKLLLYTPDYSTLANYSSPFSAIPVRYGFKPVGTIIGAPQQTIPALPVIVEAPATYNPPATTATAMLMDSTGAGVLVNVTAGGTGPPITPPAGTIELTIAPVGAPSLSLSPVLQAPFTLLFDLVPVTRGTTVQSENLGSGDATQINQSFTLQKSPLTYVSQGASVQSVLSVYVNGVSWTEVSSFYGQSPTATVYVVGLDSSGNATVTFGDGNNGARLPTGSGNITATYSYGSGLASPPAGRLTTILKPQPNLASVLNPIAVSGGADPQSPADVRQGAPASVFAFGRAISATDYRVVAEQAPGVSQAQSVWGFDQQSQRTTVTIYVAGLQPTSASGIAAQAAVQAALAGSEDPNRPVTVVVATPILLALSCTLVVANNTVLGDVLAAALAVLTDPVNGPFSPDACPIGARLYRSQLDAALMVPGVVAVQDLAAIGAGYSVGDYDDPGEGAYFALGDYSQVTAVYASAAPLASVPGGAYA